ncbi:uncharacterized protein LOC122949746 [Acropora millepora]|uniref:uncharacterized protein LOC122949746 n=1 Tax=Acropora millepora TaxID=45264 RepID=UPI001CF5E6D4|nr:uncharacterized protein LOC122949746 [Acropora millepora]
MLEAGGQDVQRSSTSTNTSTSSSSGLSSTPETVHLDDSEMNNVKNGVAEAVHLEDSSADQANNDGDNEQPLESNTEPDKEKDLIPFELHRQKAIEDTLTSMLTCSEPVTVLKEYRDRFISGRPLDVEREDTPYACEGKVIEIFVSRMNILKDAMAELITDPPIADLSFPLDVTFIGEEAADYGGPRKEFLGAAMRELRDQLFDEAGSGEYILTNDVTSLRQNYYFGAGLIFGFSMLQGGPLPCFLTEEQLQRLLVGEYSVLKESEKQFKCGLHKFGLIELVNRKPCLVFLLRKTAVRPLMYPRLVKLLKARFSEEGSNSRLEEEKIYRTFINYLKEVSGKWVK